MHSTPHYNLSIRQIFSVSSNKTRALDMVVCSSGLYKVVRANSYKSAAIKNYINRIKQIPLKYW